MRKLLAVASLFAASLAAQASLPPVPVPPQNPITPEKAILGKLLFWEEQMSSNNRVACGTCHTFAAGGGDLRRVLFSAGPDGVTPSPDDTFGSPGLPHADANNAYVRDAAFGFGAQVTNRTSPSFLTAAWFPEMFWDGRARTAFVDPETNQTTIPNGGALENQALGPVLSAVEMAHDARTWSQVDQKLASARPMALATNLPPDMAAAVANGATYPDLFQAAFGTPDINAQRIAYALATYQRTLVPDQTPWDRFQRGVPGAMTPQQVNGMNIFNGPARCNLCHVPGLFSDRQFRNLGLQPVAADIGRQAVTNNVADRGKFKVPSLRNVGLRTSLMHNGQFTNVGQVFGFYLNGGGPFLDNKDPLLQPLQVPPQQANDLITFVNTALTDPRVAAGQAPFDRPTLASQRIPAAGFQYGIGSPGSGGRVPTILAETPANVGNVDFRVGVANARGGALGTLAVSVFPATTQIQGVNVNVEVFTTPALFYVPLGGAAGVAGAGFGTVRFELPPEPSLTGITLYSQWFVWDVGVAVGLCSSRGAELRLF
jgi:cytochrome c peroxidase